MNKIRQMIVRSYSFFVRPTVVPSSNSRETNNGPWKCNRILFACYRSKIKAFKETSEEGWNQSKANLISKMNFRTPEDAKPFFNLQTPSLVKIYKVIKHDENTGFCNNRLYYIAERIKIPPSKLSAQIAKRTFIFSLSSEWLENSLNVLMEMGIPGDRVMRDLWVFKYHHETIRERLQRVKNMGIENLHPWMVRCSEEILNRFIQISLDTKNILGDNTSTMIYLANRLNTSQEVVEEMCGKIPALQTIRVTKLKSFLDFLLEEGFRVEEIVDKPRVLTASQTTVKRRLEKLRKLGVEYINLNILCRSRKDFKKYCDLLELSLKSESLLPTSTVTL